MEPVISGLLSNGTVTGLFLATLLIALVVFSIWAKKLIDTQLKQKDERINKLESDVKELQVNYKTELLNVVSETQRVLQKNNDIFIRIEESLIRLNRQNV